MKQSDRPEYSENSNFFPKKITIIIHINIYIIIIYVDTFM